MPVITYDTKNANFLKNLAFGNVVKSIFKLVSFLLTLHFFKKGACRIFKLAVSIYIKELTLYSAFMVIFPAF